MKCPKCQHVFTDPAKSKAGKSRWKGKTKAQRSAEMKRVRAQALVKPKIKDKEWKLIEKMIKTSRPTP